MRVYIIPFYHDGTNSYNNILFLYDKNNNKFLLPKEEIKDNEHRRKVASRILFEQMGIAASFDAWELVDYCNFIDIDGQKQDLMFIEFTKEQYDQIINPNIKLYKLSEAFRDQDKFDRNDLLAIMIYFQSIYVPEIIEN